MSRSARALKVRIGKRLTAVRRHRQRAVSAVRRMPADDGKGLPEAWFKGLFRPQPRQRVLRQSVPPLWGALLAEEVRIGVCEVINLYDAAWRATGLDFGSDLRDLRRVMIELARDTVGQPWRLETATGPVFLAGHLHRWLDAGCPRTAEAERQRMRNGMPARRAPGRL